MPTFSRMFFIWSLDKTYIFDAHSKTNSGALSQSFLNICDKRSAHPSCSFAAKGPLAEALLSDHDHEAPPYLPLKKMLNYTNSKSLVFGCIKDSPGVITHVVQDDLGYASRNWLKYLRCVLYKEKTGKISLYKPKKIGGCSHGFKKFYTDYLQKGALKAGCFGNAGAFLADVKMTYSIDMEILKASPRNALCDNPICSWCCLFVTYNKRAYLTFVFKKTTFLIAKLIKFSRK